MEAFSRLLSIFDEHETENDHRPASQSTGPAQSNQESTQDGLSIALTSSNNSHHGIQFHIRFTLLMLSRGSILHDTFKMATELKEANSHDDAVFWYTNDRGITVEHYVQLKHTTDSNKCISKGELLNKGDGSFSLQKYFVSYLLIREKSKMRKNVVQNFIIYTNRNFSEMKLKRDGQSQIEFMLEPTSMRDGILDPATENITDEDVLNIIGKGKSFKLKPNDLSRKDMIQELKNITNEKMKKKLTENNITYDEQDILDFFDKSIWFVNQVDENELDDLIKYELKKYINNIQVDLPFGQISDSIFDWMCKNYDKCFSADSFKTLVKNTTCKIAIYTSFGQINEYIQELDMLPIEFKLPQEILNFIQNVNDNVNILKIVIKELQFGAKKIHQALKNEQNNYWQRNSFILIKLSTLKLSIREVALAYDTDYIDLLIVTWDVYPGGEEINSLFRDIFKTIRKKQNKRIIFILPEEIGDLNNDLNQFEATRILSFNDPFKFQNLSESTQETVLKRDVYIFVVKAINIKKWLFLNDVLKQEDYDFLDEVFVPDMLILFTSKRHRIRIEDVGKQLLNAHLIRKHL